jgi:hypothetical protein
MGVARVGLRIIRPPAGRQLDISQLRRLANDR